MKKKKYYYVWQGHKTGFFEFWFECEKAVKGFPNGQHLSFDSKLKAEIASQLTYEEALRLRQKGEL